jgi:hypothetical protein
MGVLYLDTGTRGPRPPPLLTGTPRSIEFRLPDSQGDPDLPSLTNFCRPGHRAKLRSGENIFDGRRAEPVAAYWAVAADPRIELCLMSLGQSEVA